MAKRTCAAEGCGERFTGHANKKYHSKTCRDREAKRRYRDARKVEVIDPKRIRKGDAYATLIDSPELVDALLEKTVTQRTAAQAIGIGESMFSEAWASFLAERAAKLKAAEWTRDDEIERMLAVSQYDWDGDPETLEDWLDRAVEGFVRFRHRYFRTPQGPYYTKSFHRTWIRGTLKAIVTGGRYLILSPPRHGKSELLVHFSDWLIARNPDIRIMWIGGNGDLAGDMTGEVKRTLESNEQLRLDVLGPAAHWKPSARNQSSWGKTKFTVSNRDPQMTNKAPTMIALGRGSTVLSRDVDFIICDDIEDLESTESETTRRKTRNWWFNSVESRKEEHTAWMTIGSRQHPDDLYAYMLDDDEWETTVDSAHDQECPQDPDIIGAHTDCMLFPELRTYRWLAGKRRTAEAQGLLANFEMVYLNDPRPEGTMVFVEESVDAAKNWERRYGIDGLPAELGYHLVAGLDPSATGFQAGFCWGWVKPENKLYAVDLHNRKGGGVYQALALFEEWLDIYGVKHWVIEENGFQKAIRENRDVREWAQRNGVYLEGHQTQGGNKHDPLYGVGAMANLYDQRMVDIPWGDEATREKFRLYVRQLLRFVDNADLMRRTTRKSDILMASWFPMKVIRRLRKEAIAQASMGDEFSYVGFDSSDFDEVPW